MDAHSPAPPGKPALLRPEFTMVEKPALEQMTGADWALIEAQRKIWLQGRQAREVLSLFETAHHDASFGYALSMYEHGLQSATLALQSGADEEFVVVCLLHDIGFTVSHASHGEFSAALLRPFISEERRFVLEMHQVFQSHHAHDHPVTDPMARERFRGHPHFAATAHFVEHFDQNAVDPHMPTLPIAAFAPMVHRLFAKPPSKRFANP
jgi:predicted HD phosphohydrolase